MDAVLVQKLRASTPNEILDYLLLTDLLKEYKAPRDVITNLLKSKIIIRVKKGLYVFGDYYRKQLVSSEILSTPF